MKRIRQLDGVRALAMLAVFFGHALRGKMLWIGVDLFFILSGFLITGILLNAKRHSLGAFFAHFYSRRALRILPPYILILLFGSLFAGVAWTQHWYFYILLTNLLLPLHIPHPVMFDPLWSLAVEEQFYLVWPFAVYCLSERRLRQLCIGLIVAAPVLRGLLRFPEFWPTYTLTPFRMDLLAVGGLLCLEWRGYREKIERLGSSVGPLLGVAGLAGLLTLKHYGLSSTSNTSASNVLIYESSLFLCLGVMVYALGGRGVGWLCVRPITYIGQISYSMYLVHLGMLMLVDTRLSGLLAATVALALTIAYAAISWALLEGPLLTGSQGNARAQLEPTKAG